MHLVADRSLGLPDVVLCASALQIPLLAGMVRQMKGALKMCGCLMQGHAGFARTQQPQSPSDANGGLHGSFAQSNVSLRSLGEDEETLLLDSHVRTPLAYRN